MARRRNPDKRMKLSGHLRELRKRLFRSAYAIIAGTAVGWNIYDFIFIELQEPIIRLAEEANVNATVNFGSVVSAFDLRLQVSFFTGVFLTSPFWLYQIWAFIAPAFKKRERRYTVIFALTSTPLFLGGAYFAWTLFPGFVRALLAFTPEGSSNVINASEYVLFTVRILFVFGIAFVLPVILVLLNALGVLSGKSILKSWRPAVFVICLIAALATPVSDPVSMFLLIIPLLAFYYLAAGVALANDKRRAMRAKNSQDAEDIASDYTPDEIS
jgi:sec-independent protein translocase protein TatC